MIFPKDVKLPGSAGSRRHVGESSFPLGEGLKLENCIEGDGAASSKGGQRWGLPKVGFRV